MTSEVLTEIQRDPPSPPSRSDSSTGWWGRYAQYGLGNLTETARSVLENDSRALVSDCFRMTDHPDAWLESRVRTGLVVGAVQSGKTGSMLGVAALLLDAGIDVLVVLAGTRVALWKQTYERFLKQLDGTTPEGSSERWSSRVLVPQPMSLLRGDARATPTTYMSAAGPKIENALLERRPVILIIPKIEAHLLAASRELHARIAKISSRTDRPLHMVVMDDEADDASVLDAADSKTIPRRIEMLWSSKLHGQTVSPQLYATYVAYTATPQANFLQQSHNPLSPRSFCAALRAPFREGSVFGGKRSATFAEPRGVAAYYCGGELFYASGPVLDEGGFCSATAYPDATLALDSAAHERQVRHVADRMLLDGMRGYLVAAAIRVMEARSKGKWTPSEIPASFMESHVDRLPPPTCMLVHPSARQEVHADEARRLFLLSGGHDPDVPDAGVGIDDVQWGRLDVAALSTSVRSDPTTWRRWLASYRATRSSILTWPGASSLFVPTEDDWETLADILINEVLPRVEIRIINSDPTSEDRPEYSPIELGEGMLAPPRDLLTIFVSGNVMSRGITLEGLTTSVFTRPASEPAADTQMQMQRWFGYRGSHVHMCRVLAFDDQLRLFRMYHEHDMAMRNEILAGMGVDDRDGLSMVLQGPRSLATAKVPTTRLPLHPGPTPSVKLIEADDLPSASANAQLLADVLEDGDWADVGPSSQPRGRIRTEPVDLLRVATILERLRYATYDPAGDDVRYTRWRSLEDQLGLQASERPLFRPPGTKDGSVEIEPRGCPYAQAAYLRLWNAALKRNRCDGLYPSDSEGTSWALAQPLLRAPVFYIGVAYGDGGLSRWPRLASLGVQAMKRGEAGGVPRMLNTLWGRRSEGGRYHGDQLFDYNFTGHPAPRLLGGGPLWRERGHPGLLLFHVIRTDTDLDAVTVGLAIPHGGPEQFASLPAAGKRTQ